MMPGNNSRACIKLTGENLKPEQGAVYNEISDYPLSTNTTQIVINTGILSIMPNPLANRFIRSFLHGLPIQN